MQNQARSPEATANHKAGTSSTQPPQPEATSRPLRDAFARLQESAERAKVLRYLRQRPLLSIGIAVGGGLGVAAVIGAAETAVALSAGLLAYEALAGSRTHTD